MQSARLVLPLLLIFAFTIACEAPLMEVLPGSGVSQQELPIYGGSPPDQAWHGAVVSLHQLAKGGNSVYASPFCSGTLITPTVLVTAGHCLDVAKNTSKGFQTMDPGKLAIYVGDTPLDDITSHLYLVSETLIHPDYNPKALVNDIALVRLSRDIVEPVTPVPSLPAELGFTDLDIGAMLDFAGFGRTETGSIGVKLHVEVPLGGLGCSVAGCPDGGVAATQISYLQPEAGPCSGDSGGPAFIDRGGVTYLAGVTSYGDSYCTIYGVSTRTDAFDSWIDAFANPVTPDCSSDGWCNPECAEGADPDCATGPDCSADGWCNPECADSDDPDCGVSLTCGDGVCAADESCDGRDGTASCIEDCPGKLGGKPSKRFCWVSGVCVGGGCP